MKIAFRVDASSLIGTGHFMRCLTFADALKRCGAQIRFVSRGLPLHLIAMLAEKEIEFVPLKRDATPLITGNLAHSDWLGTSQKQDAEDSVLALSDLHWDWLVVDHYALDAGWEGVLRRVAKQILVIDDIADRQHECDVLLDQNFYSDMQTRYTGKVPPHCQLLLGPRYALLRDEFRMLREQVKPRSGPVKRILVFFGGVDAENYTGVAIKALSGIDMSDLQVDVVIGALHPCRTEIEDLCATHRYVCHVQTSHMAQLMAEADLAIGAGGSATWERCSLGLPALTFCTADNQKRQVADAAEQGFLYAPAVDSASLELIKRHAVVLLENPAMRKLISITALSRVDGRGAARIIHKMGAMESVSIAPVSVRRALTNDAALVWPWRNSEATRRYFFDPSSVSLETHMRWWDQSLLDPLRVLLVGEVFGQAFGVIRFDFDKSERALISIYLNPSMTGEGLGRALLNAGLYWLRVNYTGIELVAAEIIPENQPSLRLFKAAGFTERYRLFCINV
ncbi:MAG: UDP-2,4-diacetamido-2,4,6-trideoxy-beta-L-altropyranose hydrolase [Gallionella sp.]|jgi:UDP-2,4-diacetamido-2,4,6-trideoxy-beta-L-altropyranose hydrolase